MSVVPLIQSFQRGNALEDLFGRSVRLATVVQAARRPRTPRSALPLAPQAALSPARDPRPELVHPRRGRSPWDFWDRARLARVLRRGAAGRAHAPRAPGDARKGLRDHSRAGRLDPDRAGRAAAPARRHVPCDRGRARRNVVGARRPGRARPASRGAHEREYLAPALPGLARARARPAGPFLVPEREHEARPGIPSYRHAGRRKEAPRRARIEGAARGPAGASIDRRGPRRAGSIPDRRGRLGTTKGRRAHGRRARTTNEDPKPAGLVRLGVPRGRGSNP